MVKIRTSLSKNQVTATLLPPLEDFSQELAEVKVA